MQSFNILFELDNNYHKDKYTAKIKHFEAGKIIVFTCA